MTRDQLTAKLADIELEDFEVKEAQSDIIKNVWDTVSAFSNTSGGWLIFGVKKSGKSFFIVGVDNPEKIEQDFTKALRTVDKFNVIIVPKCLKFQFDNNNVLAFYISVSANKPVYFNSIKNTFVRTASGEHRATQAEIDAMYRDQSFGTQSSKTIPGKNESSIDTNSLDRFRDYMSRYNSGSPYNELARSEFLEKLRIVSNGELSYSGLLLLGKNDAIQDRFPVFRVDYLEIPGNSYTDGSSPFSFRLPEQENLWEYYFTILDRLRKYIDIPINLTLEGFASEDVPQLYALREALVNFLIMAMKDHTNSTIDRQNILNNRYALSQIQKYVGLPGMLFQVEFRFTKEMVAYFFEIDTSAIDRYLAKYETELKRNGYILTKGKQLKEFKLQFVHLIDKAKKINKIYVSWH